MKNIGIGQKKTYRSSSNGTCTNLFRNSQDFKVMQIESIMFYSSMHKSKQTLIACNFGYRCLIYKKFFLYDYEIDLQAY